MANTIFLSTSDSHGTAYTIRSFKEEGFEIVAGDCKEDALGHLLADKFYQLPRQDAPNYFDHVYDIIEQENIDYYVPYGEFEALWARENESEITKRNCVLIAADLKTLKKSVYKHRSYDYLKENSSIPILEYELIENVEDFDQALNNFDANSLCVKPSEGSGTRGFTILTDEEPNATDIFTNKSQFRRMTIDRFRDILARDEDPPPLLLMEHLRGKHYDTNILSREGNVLHQSIRTREEAKIGTITRGTIVRNEKIEKLNSQIVEALGTTGLICTQFIGDKLIEINPRWSTSLHTETINEYLMSLELHEGKNPTLTEKEKQTYPGLKMIRYFDIITYRD